MASSTGTPQITFHSRSVADGSVTYTSATNPSSTSAGGGALAGSAITITCGVNYPVEVPFRSDELPAATLIEVNLSPHNAVSLVKERHVESRVRHVLESIVINEQVPRALLQVSLQVMDVEIDDSQPGGIREGGQGESYLPVLAAAVDASVLGCLDARVAMKDIAAAVLVGVMRQAEKKQDQTKEKVKVVVNPGIKERKRCRSLHVLAFATLGELVLMESEGLVKMAELEYVVDAARKTVLSPHGRLSAFRRTFEQDAEMRARWREG